MKRPLHRLLRVVAIVGAIALLDACSSLPGADTPKEYLDEATAATIDVVGRPLIFAHERPEIAAHVRDYVTLAAASVNRGGKIDYVLVTYFWSTLDKSDRRSVTPSNDGLVIAADDRRIRPTSQGLSAREAGIGFAVHAPPGRRAAPQVYGTDLETLRFFAESRHLAILTGADDAPVSYDIW